MKLRLWMIGCLCLFGVSLAQAESQPNYFLLTYAKGSNWNESISYNDQPGLKKHHAYLQGLHINDQLVMGGPVADVEGVESDLVGVMLLRTASLEEAHSLVDQDPGVQARLVYPTLIPWDARISSMRFVRRKPMPDIDDPEQSFSIKRVDPESRINLDN